MAGGRLAQTRAAQFINGQRHGIAAKTFLADKGFGSVDQFTQIFEPILAVFVGLVVFFKPAVRQHQHDDLAQRAAGGLLTHHVQLGHKRAQIGARLARHGTHAVMQRTTGSVGNVLQLLKRAGTDAARRKIHHAHETGVVVRIFQQAQIRQRMLDFSALEKPQAAVHPVRHAGIEQRGFHHPALRIAAVQQRNFLARRAVAHQLLDLIDKPLRLGKVAGGLVHAHRLAGAGLGRQVLAKAFAVVADQRIG